MKSEDVLTAIRKKIVLTDRELFLYLENKRSIDQKSHIVHSLYELLHHILPLALSLDLNKNFGFSRIELDPIKRHQAIPYKSSEVPSEGSSYSKYLLTSWLTICAARTEGIFKNLLENILLSFKLKYMMAVIPKEELNAEFQKYFPGKDVGNIQAYLSDITNFHKQFSKSEKFVTYCLQYFILPSVERYDTQLVSTPYDFCAQSAKVKGFTGTSSSKLFLSPLRLVDLNPDNIESIFIKLRREVTEQFISYMDRNDNKAIISLILDKIRNNKNLRFIIELGGWFRGRQCANFEVASALLAGAGDDIEIEWVVFFNGNKLSAISKKDPLNIIGFETSDPIELAGKLGEDLSKRLVYIDQQHARGADLPQTETTEAIVTVHETTTLDEFAQGGTRLRHLLSGKQGMHIMIPEELKELCANFDQLEMLFSKNQSEQRTNMAPQAIVGQLRSHVRRLIFKKILTTSDLATKKQLLQQSKELFILQNESDDSLNIETEEPTEKLLNAYAEKLILLYKSLMPEEALETLSALKKACKEIINSKLAICKPTLLTQSNTLLPQQESDEECQMRMHMSIAQQLTEATECQMTHANQSEQTHTEEQELQDENETEIKQKVANARLIARPNNLAFPLNTWTIADFQNLGSNLLKINNMQFLRFSEISEVSSCHLDPDIYMTENAAYTLRIQDPSLARPMIHVLGIATPSAMKFIILSVDDNAYLFDSITTLSEQVTAGHYIWLTTLQAGIDIAKTPPAGHPQHYQMLALWEQIQFCSGNVQYLVELANKKQLQWLITGNVLEKLSVLTKLVSLYNPSHREYLDSLALKINRLISELSQPLLIPQKSSNPSTEASHEAQKDLRGLSSNQSMIIASGQPKNLLWRSAALEIAQTDELLKPMDGSLGSSRLTRAHQS